MVPDRLRASGGLGEKVRILGGHQVQHLKWLAIGGNLPGGRAEHNRLAARHMLVGIERGDGVQEPVLVPGNPVKIVGSPQGGDRRIPWLGEHTDEILQTELGLDEDEIAKLRATAVVG